MYDDTYLLLWSFNLFYLKMLESSAPFCLFCFRELKAIICGYAVESCDQNTCTMHVWITLYIVLQITIYRNSNIFACVFHAFCLHIKCSCGLVCLSSPWATHSSQDQEQSTIKLVFLLKAETMGITRPPSSLAKQVSRFQKGQKVRNYGLLDAFQSFISVPLMTLFSLSVWFSVQ